ncbi:hypothetical protein K227x_02150 [Rubripirellula lacrimiformis]|uniref:Protein MtfA n=1 Tax=Rubripirellula lacrimiformis TaxID=1930273 RepID=A0A517N3Z7_9BACT|nr:M90 family metallopeptidase [Rubripirellula lacrimiformis]QDT01846.1 hypothetical protein K227x_02150 [Rubripirellula lacrimiformis]
MLVTPQSDQRNFRISLGYAGVVGAVAVALSLASPWWLALGLLAPVAFAWSRRSTLRRVRVIATAFPDTWERTLQTDVAFFQALDDPGKQKFRNLVKVFVDEVAITGIRTDVDDRTVALVAASAVIPIFGFDHWEYSGLGEVLIYPSAYDNNFSTDDGADRRTLGMVGAYHLSGVMILSKPDLIAGFSNRTDKRNVGIHEFSHLVDKEDGSIDGAAEVAGHDAAVPWIHWVAQELRRQPGHDEDINDYAYTNAAEYFAVLSEYFFDSPATLAEKHPQVYQMLEKIYRQDPQRLLANVPRRKRRVGRNDDCPCGSGKKFKHCCMHRRRRRL